MPNKLPSDDKLQLVGVIQFKPSELPKKPPDDIAMDGGMKIWWHQDGEVVDVKLRDDMTCLRMSGDDYDRMCKTWLKAAMLSSDQLGEDEVGVVSDTQWEEPSRLMIYAVIE